MRKQRMAALLMVLVEAAIVTVLWDTRATCALIGVAAVAGCLMPGRLPLSRKQINALSLVLAVVFILRWRFFTTSIVPRVNLIWPVGLGYCLAEFFMALQVLSLFVTGRQTPIRPFYLLCGAAAMVMGGDILLSTASGMLPYTLAAMVFSGLAAVFITSGVERVQPESAGPRSRMHEGVAAVLLLTALAGAGTIATVLHRYRDDVDNLFLGLVTRTPVGPTGFSGRPRLGSIAEIKADKGKKTVLRVFAESEPGYLRGRVFDVYDHGEWRVSHQKERHLPAADPPQAVTAVLGEDQNVFADGSPHPDGGVHELRSLDVWPDSSLGSVVFAPLEWRLVGAPVKTILTDDMKALESPEIPRGTDYTVLDGPGPAVAAVMPRDERARYTLLPEDLSVDIHAKAESIFEGHDTDAAKIGAVVNYLQCRHQYVLGIRIPRNTDPLTHFLVTEPPPAGHCEYFATAAAVLLRLGGIPTRYVTGLVAAEQNAHGEYWAARNRDAHAWVEAYVDDRGWTLVEATPSQGVPAPPVAGPLASRLDALVFWFKRTAQAIRDLNIRDLLAHAGAFAVSLLQRALTTTPGLVMLTALATVLALLGLRRHRSRRRTGSDPVLRSLWPLLERMDRRLRKHGLTRRPNETLHQFAHRLESSDDIPEPARGAAVWYRRYAALRYSGQANEEDISRLETDVFQRAPR